MALAAPLPVAERRGSRLWRVPVYWHLLSLDAPTLAVLWAWSFARAAGVWARPSSLAVLGVGTWLIYVADRLLDVRAGGVGLRERHFFHGRHRGPLLMGAAAAGILLLWLIAEMPALARRDDTVVFAASMMYFGGVHVPRAAVRRWFPREAVVGVVFACATAVPAWCALGAERGRLVWPVLLFVGLCTLNCVAIEVWERARPAEVAGMIAGAAVGLGVAAAALMAVGWMGSAGEFRIGASVLVSAMLLWGLDRLHRRAARLDPEARARFLLGLRVAADAALLTPLLFVVPWRP